MEDRDERRGSLAIVRPQPVPSPCGASDLHDKWMTSCGSHTTKHQKIPPTAEGGQDLGVVRCVVRAAGERLSHRSSRVEHVRFAFFFVRLNRTTTPNFFRCANVGVRAFGGVDAKNNIFRCG